MPTVDKILFSEVQTLERNIKRIANDLNNRIMELINSLITENGLLQSDAEQLVRIANIVNDLYPALTAAGYDELVQGSLANSQK